MSDTEILDAIEKHGIQVWPDVTKVIQGEAKRVGTWSTFARDSKHPGQPVQKTRSFLRAALVDTIDELEKR